MQAKTDIGRPNGPDFFCIGAQKAGTGWLYEQLRSHPDFWMPPMKELHYFDRLASRAGSTARRSLPFARKDKERIEIARGRVRDQRDRDFLDRLAKLSAHPSIDLEGYADLFELKNGLISGDITPGYSILDNALIEQIAARFADTKNVFIARDPVERAWSQISMYVRRRLIDPFDPNDVNRITEHLRRPEIARRSYPSEIVCRWRAHINPDRFRIYFFDDLKSDAPGLRKQIIEFLGGDPAKPSAVAPDHNAKALKEKLPLTAAGRAHLAKFFEPELRACAIELGGPATHWPKRYGL